MPLLKRCTVPGCTHVTFATLCRAHGGSGATLPLHPARTIVPPPRPAPPAREPAR